MSRPDVDVRLVRTGDDVGEFMEWLEARLGEPLAIDTETTGLEWWTYSFTRLWQIGDHESGWAIPASWWGKVIEGAMHKIVRAGTKVIMHNAKFDMHAMEVMGWEIPNWANIVDTTVLMHLERSDLSRGLKGKHAANLLGGWIYSGKDLLNKVAKDTYGLSPTDKWKHIPVDEDAYWAYGVMDTVQTRLVYDKLRHIETTFADQVQREMHYMQIMYRAEQRGIRVDEKYTLELQAKLAAEVERDLFYLQANGLDNPNSNDQVVDLFETDFGFVPWEFTDKGNPSVNKNVLAVLAKAGGLQTDVVEALIRYKRNVKWKGTYVDRFITSSDLHGFVHPSVNTMAARTGRSSIGSPPLQTLPSRDPMIRRCLLPPSKHDWYSLDYSNQEPRTLAHYGRSPRLLKYFTEGDGTGSIHDFVATEMFGNYSKEQRSLAKIFGLSRSYGAGAQTMSQASGLAIDEVQRLLPSYDSLMGLEQLNRQIEEVAQGRMPLPFVTTAGGRRVYADEDKTYTLVNFLMQGSGADMLKDAAIRLDLAGLSDSILVPVHDELTFGFPRGEEGRLMAEEARYLMQTDEFLVPMPVDIDGPAKSWGHIYDKEMV